MMKNILFVDDEQPLIDALRDLLRKDRKRWNMTFATSGAIALEELSRANFDVVVTDMRMPGMSGAQLLERVRDTQPKATRIVLSGQADRAAMTSALSLCHRYLAKPCDVATLREVISQSCEAQDDVIPERIRGLIGQLDQLPMVPEVRSELLAKLSKRVVDAEGISQLAAKDPCLSLRLLQLTHAPDIGTVRTEMSISRAVAWLGPQLVRELVEHSELSAQAHQAGVIPEVVGSLGRRAHLASRVAAELPVDSSDLDLRVTGALFSGIGRLILTLGMPDQMKRLEQTARQNRRLLHDLEQEAFGISHGEVGGWVLRQWGMPLPLVQVVSSHQKPSDVHAPANPDALTAVHFATSFAEAFETRASTPFIDFDVPYFERQGFDGNRLTDWLQRARRVATTA